MTTRIRWTKEKNAKLLAMKAEGVPNKDIAEYFGITAHAVNVKCQRLRNPNLHQLRPRAPSSTTPARRSPATAWKRNGERWTDEENAELVARKDRGENFSDIGIVLNRTLWSCKVQYHALKRGTAATPGEVAATQRTNREAVNSRIHEVRCETLHYASPFSEMLGEPPIGRRAINKREIAPSSHGVSPR
jgi:hypothetical protein